MKEAQCTLIIRIKHSLEVIKKESGNWKRMVLKKIEREGIHGEWKTETKIVQL